MDCAHQLVTGDLACDTTMEYESVCGNGLLETCVGPEKERGLARVMAHYCGEKPYELMRFCSSTRLFYGLPCIQSRQRL